MSKNENKSERKATTNLGFDIREAIKVVYNNGNRGCVSKAVCDKLGISQTHLDWYNKSMTDLYEAIDAYCRAKHNGSTKEEKDALRNECFTCWKQLFQFCEESKDSNDLHANEDDIEDLVSVCQKVGRDRVNLHLEDDFVAKAQWENNTPKVFQKKVEAILGMMVYGIETKSPEQAEYDKAMGRIVNKIRKKNAQIKAWKDEIDRLEGHIQKAKGDEIKKYFESQKSKLKTQIKNAAEYIEEQESLRDKYEAKADSDGYAEAVKAINLDKESKTDVKEIKSEVKSEIKPDDAKVEEKAKEKVEEKSSKKDKESKPKSKPKSKKDKKPEAQVA